MTRRRDSSTSHHENKMIKILLLFKSFDKLYRVSQKKNSYKIFGFGLFVVFWTPLDTDLDTFGLFGRFWTLLDSLDTFGHFGRFWTLLDVFGHFGRFWTLLDTLEAFRQFYCCFFWDTLHTKMMYATSPSPIPEYWVTWAWGYHHPPVTTIVDSLTYKLSLSFFG